MRDLGWMALIAAIAACGGTTVDTRAPSPGAPPGPEVRTDAPLPSGAIARCGTELMMSRWPVTAGSVSDDGETRVIESRDGELVVRDPGHARAVTSLGPGLDARFSRDGKSVFKLQSSADRQTLTLVKMDAESGAERFEVSATMEVFQPEWVVGRDGTVTIAGVRQVASFAGETGASVRDVPLADRRVLALASDAPVALFMPTHTEILTLFDLSLGKPIREVSAPDELRELPHRYLLSSDGRRIVAVSASGVWATEPDKDRLEQRVGFKATREDSYAGVPEALLIDNERTLHVTLRERSVRVGLATREMRALPGSSSTALATSASGKYLLASHGIRLSLEGSRYEAPPSDETAVAELGFFAGESRLATLSDKLNVWDGSTCKHLATLPDVGSMIATSRDAPVLAVTRRDGTISVLDGDLHERKRLRTPYEFRSLSLDAAGKSLWVVVWAMTDEPTPREASPPGTLALPATRGVFRIDLASWQITKLEDGLQLSRVERAAVSPSGERVALSGSEGILTYEPSEKKPFFRSLGGRLYDFAGPRALLTFEPATGMLRGHDLEQPFQSGPFDFAKHVGGQPLRVAAAPSASKVALAYPKEVALLDPREGRLLGSLAVRDPTALAFSKNGARVAIASKEGVLLWDSTKLAAPSQVITTERPLPGIASVLDLAGGYWSHVIAISGGRLGWFTPNIQKPFSTLVTDTGVTRAAATSEDICLIASGEARCEGRSSALFRTLKPSLDRRSLAIKTAAKASDISLGNGVACVLDIAGGVTCIGEPTPAFGAYKKATQVLSDASAVAVGRSHACALKKDGRVACWGESTEGQVGSLQNESVQIAIPGTVPRHQVMQPFVVPNVQGATAIATGTNHTCALLATGTVTCWGSNDSGQCGVRRGEHLDPGIVDGLTDVVAISAAGDRTCALSKGGDVSCWGGFGANVELYGPTSLAKQIEPAKAMRVIDESVCVEKRAGGVSCFSFSSPHKRY